MRVRSARVDDLPGVYRVCHETGMPVGERQRNPELLGHVYAGPYVIAPGTRARVVVDAGGVGGYILAALDTEAFENWVEANWYPPLRLDYPREASRSGPDQEIVDLIHDPPRAPAGVAEKYPAHLHIDLLPRLRSRGLGTTLIEALFDELAAADIGGVHLGVGVDNPGAIRLYQRRGFEEVGRTDGSLYMGRLLR